MKVLVVSNMYPDKARPYYGIFVYEQVEAIKRLHPDITIDVYFIDGKKGKLEYLRSIVKINSLINKRSYDLVHIHYGLSGLFMLSPFRKKVRSLVTFHGSDIQPQGGKGKLTLWISRQVAKRCSACIVLNDSMQRLVASYNKNNSIIPCSVNYDIFKPKATKRNNEIPIVVFPSSHDNRVKDYPLFKNVLSILRSKYNVQCKEIELKGLSRQQIAEIFNKADLMLLTSKSEGSPQVVKEAMACNLPIVSTPVGDVPKLLSGVRDCYVSKEHSAEELATLVVESLSHTSKGISGRTKIEQLHLDEKSIADRIYHLYEKSKH